MNKKQIKELETGIRLMCEDMTETNSDDSVVYIRVTEDGDDKMGITYTYGDGHIVGRLLFTLSVISDNANAKEFLNTVIDGVACSIDRYDALIRSLEALDAQNQQPEKLTIKQKINQIWKIIRK